jgi:hypothetical protein
MQKLLIRPRKPVNALFIKCFFSRYISLIMNTMITGLWENDFNQPEQQAG